MKAVIGQFYSTLEGATKRAEELKKLRRGRVAFVVVGVRPKEFMVISESAARACGYKIPYTARRYGKLPAKLNS